MPLMNGQGPPQGTGPMTGRQQGVQPQQQPQQQQQGQEMANQLREMDHEQLVMLTLQLIARLKQVEARMQAGNQGGQPKRPVR